MSAVNKDDFNYRMQTEEMIILLTEIARLRRRCEWQPIETVPKDGTAILAWTGHSHEIVEWDVDSKAWLTMEDALSRRVTHWMPLPEPPK